MTTARAICTRALKELMFTAEGETPSSEAITDALNALNAMAARWRTQSMVIPELLTFPTGVTWRGYWETNIVYSVNDAVLRSGSVYKCATAHTASLYDKPGVGPNTATYWTAYPLTPLALEDDWPLGLEFESGVISMLAVEIAPAFNLSPAPLTERRASAGLTALMAAYMPITNVRVDYGITRMPSQIWPYNIDQVS